MMKRRSFLAALAAVPFLGRQFEAAPVGDETYTVHYLDDVKPRLALMDPYVPATEIYCLQGVMCLPSVLARRMPKRDAMVNLRGREFAGWRLS